MALDLYSVKAVIALDAEGERLFAKYYTPDELTSVKEQRAFETALFQKTHRTNSEIILYDGKIVVFKSTLDLFVYVLGDAEENELLLANVLSAFHDTVSMILRNQVDKRTVLENLDYVLLALDEIVDEG